jgi:hypothetical protein
MLTPQTKYVPVIVSLDFMVIDYSYLYTKHGATQGIRQEYG